MTYTIDVANKTDAELATLIANHEERGKTNAPVFIAAISELDRRKSRPLVLERTFEMVMEAAAHRRFVTYKDVVERAGLSWDKFRWPVFDHVGRLSQVSINRASVSMSAIIVAEDQRQSGLMKDDTLKGFLALARKLGREPGLDEVGFLRAEQEKVFAWAGREANR